MRKTGGKGPINGGRGVRGVEVMYKCTDRDHQVSKRRYCTTERGEGKRKCVKMKAARGIQQASAPSSSLGLLDDEAQPVRVGVAVRVVVADVGVGELQVVKVQVVGAVEKGACLLFCGVIAPVVLRVPVVRCWPVCAGVSRRFCERSPGAVGGASKRVLSQHRSPRPQARKDTRTRGAPACHVPHSILTKTPCGTSNTARSSCLGYCASDSVGRATAMYQAPCCCSTPRHCVHCAWYVMRSKASAGVRLGRRMM